MRAMANALPLLCPDGAVGVAVAARDEAVQLRPLGERHHQGGGRGSLYYDKPPSRCGSRGDRDGGGGDGDGGGGLGDDGGGGGDSSRPVAAPGSTGSLGGMLAPRLGDPLSGGRPRGQLAQYKIAPRRDSGKLLLVLDCGR